MEVKNDTKFNKNAHTLFCKKHTAAYVIPVFILLFGLLASSFGLGEGLSFYFGMFLVLLAIYRILKLRNIQWIYSDQKLYIESGVFSWQKASFQIPIEDIYEAFYYKSFFSSMLGYKTIAIRRTDGTTSSFAETKMDNVQEMVNAINADLDNLKKNNKSSNHQVFNTVILSVGDELKKLQELHLQGYLTDEEFNKQKQKVLSQH